MLNKEHLRVLLFFVPGSHVVLCCGKNGLYNVSVSIPVICIVIYIRYLWHILLCANITTGECWQVGGQIRRYLWGPSLRTLSFGYWLMAKELCEVSQYILFCRDYLWNSIVFFKEMRRSDIYSSCILDENKFHFLSHIEGGCRFFSQNGYIFPPIPLLWKLSKPRLRALDIWLYYS